MQIGGVLSGIDHDRLTISGGATLAGELGVEMILGFELEEGMEFTLIDIGGTRTGTFGNYAQNSAIGNFNGLDLRLSYFGGDGNDVVAYAFVPEPNTAVLLGLGLAAVSASRRRSLIRGPSRTGSKRGNPRRGSP
jgi:hypothetical protein